MFFKDAMTTMMPPLAQIRFSTSQVSRSKQCSSSGGGLGSSIHSTITATSDEKKSPMGRKVEFKSNVRVRKVSSHKSFSAEERKAMWYSPKESKLIRASAVDTVKNMMRGGDVDADKNDCSRGLEFKTPKRNKVRQKKKQLVIWSVIDAQDRFMEENDHTGDDDLLDLQEIRDRDNSIANVYREQTGQCAQEAFNRGLKDAYIATKC
jgi:hypothetical protein